MDYFLWIASKLYPHPHQRPVCQETNMYHFFPFWGAIMALTTHPCPSTSVPIFAKILSTFSIPFAAIFISTRVGDIFIYQMDSPILFICNTGIYHEGKQWKSLVSTIRCPDKYLTICYLTVLYHVHVCLMSIFTKTYWCLLGLILWNIPFVN